MKNREGFFFFKFSGGCLFLSCCVVAKFCLTLCDPVQLYVAYQAPLSMGFPRQEYWIGLSFPPPGIFDPGIELMSPTLAGGFFTTEPLGKPLFLNNYL